MATPAQSLASDTGLLLDAGLLAILCFRRIVTRFPFFTAFIALDLCWSIGGSYFGLGRSFASYALMDALASALQVGLVVEILSEIIPRNNQLAAVGRKRFLLLASCGLVIAATSSFLFAPSGWSAKALLMQRTDIFVGLLICEAVVALMLAASHVGLGWRNHVLAIGQGLMLWALASVLVMAVGPYFTRHNIPQDSLFYARSIVYFATVAYWSVSLWRNEPVRKPISPEMRKYIVALDDRLQYDLRKVGH